MSARRNHRCFGLLGLCMVLAAALTATTCNASGEPLASIPFEVVRSHVVIPVSIDGSPPLNFVFDNASGGTVVHSSTAEALGIGGATVVAGGAMAVSGDAIQIVDGQIVMGGAAVVQAEGDSGEAPVVVQMSAEDMQVAGGDSIQIVQVAGQMMGSSGAVVMGGQSTVAEVTLGELTLSGVELSALPLTHLTMPSGEPIDGIIGYEILKQFIVEVDYDDGVLRVFDRDAYGHIDETSAHEVAFLLGNVAQPCVTGEITLPDGEVVSGMFVLDAGAGADIVLNSPFVREHDMVVRLGAADSPVGSVSGLTPDKTPTIESTLEGFAFCGYSLRAVPVTLNQGATGFLASEGYAGVIGNRVLSRYNITYDYAGALVYLEPISEP